jgi:predicted transcriptional regulator
MNDNKQPGASEAPGRTQGEDGGGVAICQLHNNIHVASAQLAVPVCLPDGRIVGAVREGVFERHVGPGEMLEKPPRTRSG